MNESSHLSSGETQKTQSTQLEIERHPDAEARRKMLLASLQNTSEPKEKQDGDIDNV